MSRSRRTPWGDYEQKDGPDEQGVWRVQFHEHLDESALWKKINTVKLFAPFITQVKRLLFYILLLRDKKSAPPFVKKWEKLRLIIHLKIQKRTDINSTAPLWIKKFFPSASHESSNFTRDKVPPRGEPFQFHENAWEMVHPDIIYMLFKAMRFIAVKYRPGAFLFK